MRLSWDTIYYLFKYIIYFLYIVSFLGLWNKSNSYLNIFNYLWHVVLGLLLIILYNPYIYIKSNIRRDAVFSAGIMLITSSNLILIQQYSKTLFNYMKDDSKKLLETTKNTILY